MKKTKKALALILAGLMTASMTACGSGKAAETTQAAADTAAEKADETKEEASADGASYKVGICQLVQHVALDAATEGFKDALTEEFGDKVTLMSRMPRVIPIPVLPSSTILSQRMLT